MIKEFAAGLANRHHFGDVSEVEKWTGMAQDTFMSLWDYDNHVIDYVKEKGTLSSYDGVLYMPDEFLLDVDGENPERARQKTIGLTILLDDLCIPYRIYFSGTGLHLGIPGAANSYIYNKLIHYCINFKPGDLVLINWSSPHRDEYTDRYDYKRSDNKLNFNIKFYQIYILQWLNYNKR